MRVIDKKSGSFSGISLAIQALSFLILPLSSCTYRFYPADCEMPLPGKLVQQNRLDTAVAETSGLIYLDGSFWTFNDSGGEAALYRIDPESGSVIRKTLISNALNVDWEDICMDEQYIYVADVGNNYAGRDTLVIFRILSDKLLSGAEEIEHEGFITLSFDEAPLRNRKGLSSLDCEALFAYRDSLYLFSKNWVDGSTSVFVVPSVPGHYRLTVRFSYKAKFLVTGADINRSAREVSLVGYRSYMPVVVRYSYEDDPAAVLCGGKARIYPLKAGRQVEGICYDSRGKLFISAERSLHKQALFSLGVKGH
jgi:hypothetical protein